MIDMKLEWKVDTEIQRTAWGPVNQRVRDIAAHIPDVDVVLDLGGGAGWFGLLLAGKRPVKVISLDLAPRLKLKQVSHVKGSVLDIPVADRSVSIVGANAILHHVPDNLDKCISEVARVLKSGGTMIAQEPLAHNPIATLARVLIRTDCHEEGERPLSYDTMATAISQHMILVKADFAFLSSYLLPHVQSRVPGAFSGVFRELALFLLRLDEKMLAAMPGARRYAAYVSIVARKE